MALRTPLSVTPHLYMGDSTGRPLDMGTVYFGEQDKDPEFYPINLFSDDALTLPLAQPVHTKGGYLYDKGDMVEPHAKELIYSVKVLDSYGRKVFYKGAMMRNSWNDDVIEQINTAIIGSADVARQVATDITNEAINNTAIEGGVLTDTFLVVGGSTNQAITNKGLDSISALLGINNPSNKLRLFVKNYHAGIDGGGGEFVYDAAMPKSKHNGGTVIDPDKVYPSNWADLTQKNTWFTADASNTGTGCYKRIMTDTVSSEFFGAIQKTDATVELNSFFGFVRATVLSGNGTWVKNITTTGSFNVSDTIKCDFRSITVSHWNLKLNATAPLKIIMALTCQQVTMSGYLSVKSGVYDPITKESLCDVGVAVQRCISSELPVIHAEGCRSWGVLVESQPTLDSDGNNTGAAFFNNSQVNLPRITTSDCGRKDKRVFNSSTGISGFSAAVSSITQVGNSDSQYSELSVGTLPPDVVGGNLETTYVTINKKPYQLRSVDKLTNKIQVFPIVPTEDLSVGIVHYYAGGGVVFRGADSNVITVNYIDVYDSVMGVIDHSLYGAIINQYTTHNTTISYAVGSKNTDAGPVSAICQSIYTENNHIDLVHTGVGRLHIGAINGNFSLSKCYELQVQNSRGVGNVGFKNVTFGTLRDSTFYSGRALNESNGNLICKPIEGYTLTYYSNSLQLLINAPDAAQNRLFGSQTMQVTCIGKSTTDGALTAPITVTPLNIGSWTVNGGVEAYTVSQATGKPSLVTIVWDWATKNVKIFVS